MEDRLNRQSVVERGIWGREQVDLLGQFLSQ